MPDFKSIFKRFIKSIFKRFSRAAQPLPAKLSSTETFKAKYHAFQRLLEKNNHVLELIADMEEKMSGEYLFDRHYIDTNWSLISDSILNIIENLNILSKNRYSQLYKVHDEINKDIEQFLSKRLQIPVSDFTIPIEELKGDLSNIAGGKMAHLGEIKNRLGLLVPEGFSISVFAFKRFMDHNSFTEKINEKLSALSIENMDEINRISKEMQEMVVKAEMPEDLKEEIEKAVEGLKLKIEGSSRSTVHCSLFTVSVRSSAIQEDGEFSFAGQYATFLNVPEDLILQRYKEVVASLFTPRAIFYYKTKGFYEEEMVMSVGVLRMIDAKAGGVIYTRDPNDPKRNSVLINAVWGLGKAVVDGFLEPDYYLVSKEDRTILQKKIVAKQTMLICSDKGDIEEINVPEEIKSKPCLTDDEINALCSIAMLLEDHYGSPQDIEWAIDRDNQIYILQSRPLRIFSPQPSTISLPTRIEKYNILLDKGIIACKGIGYGKAFILKDEDKLKDFPEGSVLIARQASTRFVTVMNKASAIITDIGCATEHMASISREYQVPTIFDTKIATSLLKDGQEITVDAINCNVYEGRVEELLNFIPQHSTFKDTHLFKTLQTILKWIAPLTLTDPSDENFKPQYCKTFHDIIRFAHEKAMAEMFMIGEDHDINEIHGIILKAEIPIDAHLFNINGGLKSNVKVATPDDISSIPFSALLRGMTKMRWPELRPADVKGFIGMIAHTATISEEQLYKTGEKSFALISGNYMNFSIRLGYHFSRIEAYAGENMNNNYIKFFFKGGGAVIDRRLRRVRLIKEILKRMDFRVNVVGDIIDAMLTKHKQAEIEEKLEILGKLTAYTKQLDMAMYNDDVTDMFIEEFVKEHLKNRE